MYKLKEVKITNFWHRLNAKCFFNSDVNIIIGRNGTGKTTFMNMLHAALAVDVDEMINNDFDEISIKLSLDGRSKTIRVKKIVNDHPIFQIVEYQVSRKKYTIRAIPSDDRRISPQYRRRAIEESAELREILGRIVSLSSLSVYRLRNGEEFEIKDRSGKRILSPVDFRLSQLKSELTQYQFELSMGARTVSANLQKDVLASILFAEDSLPEFEIPSYFDKEKEQSKLVSAYSRLGVLDSTIRKKISFHIATVDEAVKAIQTKNSPKKQGVESFSAVNFAAIEAFLRTRQITDFSLKAEAEINKINSPINLFIDILKEFIPDKIFSLRSGDLIVSSLAGDQIPVDKLSSGEKQLLILMIEALLQKCKPYIYLADEPEISLHIEWQRKILPAVKRLNPFAQIIAATHSPEVASKYKGMLIDMKDVVNV